MSERVEWVRGGPLDAGRWTIIRKDGREEPIEVAVFHRRGDQCMRVEFPENATLKNGDSVRITNKVAW